MGGRSNGAHGGGGGAESGRSAPWASSLVTSSRDSLAEESDVANRS